MTSQSPEILYRYRPIGNSFATTIRELKGELWCANAHLLNDPFDGLQFAQTDDRLMTFNRQRLPVKQSWGVACFTTTWQSPPMWAHYADGYSGVCIGYDYELLSKAVNDFNQKELALRGTDPTEARRVATLMDVEYKDPFPEHFHDTLSALRTKTMHWKHENEWRLAVKGVYGKGGDEEHGTIFSVKGLVRKIYFGVNCDKPTIRTLRDLSEAIDPTISLKMAKPIPELAAFVPA